ncbi:hypothetical protein [Brevibacterium pityocampae]|uniref:hypothetical protein n=1 Tax=Brevibacterium pityocampae TaxID=506594 RepID=UPI0031F0B186
MRSTSHQRERVAGAFFAPGSLLRFHELHLVGPADAPYDTRASRAACARFLRT